VLLTIVHSHVFLMEIEVVV